MKQTTHFRGGDCHDFRGDLLDDIKRTDGQLFVLDESLVGHLRVDRSRSDDATRVAQQATRSLPSEERDRAYQNLRARLDAPDQLTIDVQGRSVAIASSAGHGSISSPTAATARRRSNGRIVTTRSDVRGQVLNVSTTGDRGNSYTVRLSRCPAVCASRAGSTATCVTSRFVAELLPSSVGATELGLGTGSRPGHAPATIAADTVPGQRRCEAARWSPRGWITTSTVALPRGRSLHDDGIGRSEYRNATLDGSNIRRQDVNGSDALVFYFYCIRLNSGRSMPFDGTIQSVRTPDGKDIRVTQGAVQDRSGYNASNREHAAIGAGVGAIIGAIIGGGKGAAIGGATGGAGTLLIEGPVTPESASRQRDDHLDDWPGTDCTALAIVGQEPLGFL